MPFGSAATVRFGCGTGVSLRVALFILIIKIVDLQVEHCRQFFIWRLLPLILSPFPAQERLSPLNFVLVCNVKLRSGGCILQFSASP